MTPGEQLVHDTRRVMRRQNRQASLARITPYTMPGGPRLNAPMEPDVGLTHHLVGGGGPPLSLTFDGVLQLPAEVEAMQQRPPRPAPPVHQGCCHCAMDARKRVARSSAGGGPGALRPTMLSRRRMFDAHSHFFGASAADLLTSALHSLGGVTTGTATFERIGWLTDDIRSAGVARMVLSGFYDDTAAVDPSWPLDWILGAGGHDPAEVDYSVSFAAKLHPHYFVPLTNGFSLFDRDPVGALRARLDAWAGWKGIGEIIVHGHETDHYDKTEELKGLLRVAVEHGLPVQLHWDIGAVSAGYAEDNFAQLEDVLDAVPDAEVIIAHCGVGPYTVGITSAAVVAAWKERIVGSSTVTGLLERPHIFLDLAGMQVEGSEIIVRQLMSERDEPTDVGNFLLRQMARFPERFLLGIDAETRSLTDMGDHLGIEQYALSVPSYRGFLQYGHDKGILNTRDVELIWRTNAEDLFDA